MSKTCWGEQSPFEFGSAIVDWFQKEGLQHPWRKLWRATDDPYVVWVSEIMLQQTTIKAVSPAYVRFMRAFPNVQTLARASEDQVRRYCAGLGYYRRFNLLHKASRTAVDAGGRLPGTYREWLVLPGVGEYTAAAIASICFNESEPVVDGNVVRVISRIYDRREGADNTALKKEIRDRLKLIIQGHHPGSFNEGLMEIGQRYCRKVNPVCDVCPLTSFCLARRNESQALSPGASRKLELQDIGLGLYIPVCAGRVALVQRSSQALFLKGIQGFEMRVLSTRKQADTSGTPIGNFQHRITRYRIRAMVFSYKLGGEGNDVEWFEPGMIERQLTSSLDRKAWKIYQQSLGES